MTLQQIKSDLLKSIKAELRGKEILEIRITDEFQLYFIIDRPGVKGELLNADTVFIDVPSDELFDMLNEPNDDTSDNFVKFIEEVINDADIVPFPAEVIFAKYCQYDDVLYCFEE